MLEVHMIKAASPIIPLGSDMGIVGLFEDFQA